MTYEVNKISLSCFDDKRYIFDDRIKTLSCDHKGIYQLFWLIHKAIRNNCFDWLIDWAN